MNYANKFAFVVKNVILHNINPDRRVPPCLPSRVPVATVSDRLIIFVNIKKILTYAKKIAHQLSPIESVGFWQGGRKRVLVVDGIARVCLNRVYMRNNIFLFHQAIAFRVSWQDLTHSKVF